MLWRVVAVLTVMFWSVMSGLLVRDSYFPEESRFAVVPPKMVFDLFLRQSENFGCTLHLYHQKEKVGHANLQVARRIKPNHQTVYDIISHGSVEQESEAGVPAHSILAAWNMGCTLADAERWQHLGLKATFPQRDASMQLSWDERNPTPELLVKQGDRVVMSSKDVQMLMNFGGAGGLDGAPGMLSMISGGLAKNEASPDAMKLQAREGQMVLAGRQRKCFVLTLPVMGMHEVKMIFTEAGELARINLPSDYVLLEPAIHGLQEGAE
ncbi:hypothetical protein [Prosthecobacter vanneervenii]|uniref:Uncharacterized protein n=1 Tax=Prosthecobacter vanneervenii TaxID=48466 RepID=A0A7W7YE30_9BACT|nr:hypothetical protein [Prosthecobacter vanneervenii]MBB5034454.1 hypothetical protein [Prosthecobacter vanneervenii]